MQLLVTSFQFLFTLIIVNMVFFPSLYFFMGCSELLSRSPTARLTVDPLVFLFNFF